MVMRISTSCLVLLTIIGLAGMVCSYVPRSGQAASHISHGIRSGPGRNFASRDESRTASLPGIVTPAGDAVITVTTAADDITPNDGSVSLREAITAINAGNDLGDPDITAQNPGTFGPLDTINFNIAGAGVKTINIGSSASASGLALPAITKPVIINGYSQPGASPNTLAVGDNAVLQIELNGAGVSFGTGLDLLGGNSTVRGLVINRFQSGVGISLQSNGGNLIVGNFIGTDVTGTVGRANFSDIDVESPNNTIGGNTPAARNIISGGTPYGINVQSGAGLLVQGNYIGTNKNGSASIGNDSGVVLRSNNNQIGGTTSGAGNVISGNTFSGVGIAVFTTSSNLVQGNFIGVQADGTSPLGNGSYGVQFLGGTNNNLIGGTVAGAGNTIAFNGASGVFVLNGGSNAIRHNSIFSNGHLGIDLVGGTENGFGVTANDPGDGDSGPNNLQNFPVLASASSGGGGMTIVGSLNSTSNRVFNLDFFANDACDPSGNGQGQAFLGTVVVGPTDGVGNVVFTVNLPASVAIGKSITATAIDTITNDTSEFSGCVNVVAGGPTGALTANGSSISAVEGEAFTDQVVATFTSSNVASTASNFTATIDWGDGTAFTSGTIVSKGGGSFTVTGGHTYAEEGSYNISVTIHDSPDNQDALVNTGATVADAALNIVPVTPGVRTQFSGAGGTNVSGAALTALNAFKAAIGGSDNGANPTPQASGFRSINWDGVALDGTDFGGNTTVIVPNKVVGIPVNRFQERGVEFEEVYAVSGDGFVSVNPNVAGQFPAFSPTKTFAMFNDNTIDFSFVVPSNHNNAPVQAVTRAFGAIFLDVETPNTTSIEYFSGTTSLGKFFVPVGGSGQPEFLGEVFQNAAITNIHIELGTATLFSFNGTTVTPGPADAPPGTDLAVTDDFAYAEPTAVPTGITINATVSVPFTAKVASFTDADPNGQVSDYSAIVDWGDGTSSATRVNPESGSQITPDLTPDVIITLNISGGFDVIGTHTYTSAGTFTITTSIKDAGGAQIGAKSTAVVGFAGIGSFQFNTGTASVSESSATVALTVTRTGDTSGPASVNFETSDGTAKQKSDYTFNSGTLQFGPGDTSKVINVSLVNDVFVEGNEIFFVTLSNPSMNYQIASPSAITVTIIDNDSAPPVTNPIDDPTFFVQQQYRDFLGREPDITGLNFWVSQITSCGGDAACISAARVSVSAAFFLSIEFQETSGFVIRIQRVAFGRQSADASTRVPYLEFMRETRQVGAGVIVGQPGFDTLLEANKQAYAQQIVNSPAFISRFPITPAATYVDSLNASAAITPTAAERAAAIAAFGAGGTAGRVAALRSVADSNSLRQAELNSSFVLAEYYGYLRRNPTDAPDFNDAGYQFWLAKLNQFNGNFINAEMVKAFLLSSEYRQRFGP
jgi:CSLREA domain-containing protein